MLPTQTSVLHHKLLFKKNMLVKLCVGNYVGLNGFVNNTNDTFQNIKNSFKIIITNKFSQPTNWN